MNIINSIESNEFLVLDQFISDAGCDFDLYKRYLGEHKQIAVYRDPRDVYTTGVNLHLNWMPQSCADFVKFYEYHVKKYVSSYSEDYLLIRFENLVLNYDETVQRVIDFLGLTKTNHMMSHKFFNPNVSIKNIGLYKSYPNQEAIKYIEKELAEYCYYGKKEDNK